MVAKRTAKQKAASARNLEKARKARASGNNAAATNPKPSSAADPKLRNKPLTDAQLARVGISRQQENARVAKQSKLSSKTDHEKWKSTWGMGAG